MAIWDFRPKADLWTGLAIGAGLLVAPVVIPVIADVARPVAKAVIKAGFMLYEKSRELFAEASEGMEDLAAEVKSEMQEMIAEVSDGVENLVVEAKSEMQAELAPVKGKGAPAKGKRA